MKKAILFIFSFFLFESSFSQTTANTSIFPTASGTTATTFVGVKSTQAAGYKVSVQGALKLWGTGNTFNTTNFSPTLMLDNRTATTGRKYYMQSSNDGYFRLFDSSVAIPRFVIGNGGYVGVGITNPSYMLDVNGTMRSASGLHIGPLPVNYGAANINISSFMDKNSFANSVMTLSSTETGGSGTYPTQLIFAQEGASVGWSLQSVNQNVSYSNLLLNKNGGNVGIGVTPDAKLHVAGTFKLVDGTQGAGKVLTSDANGLASWVTPSGGGGSSQWTTNGSNIHYNTGNVGLGITEPLYKLDVNGTSRFTGPSIMNSFTTTAISVMTTGTNTSLWTNTTGGTAGVLITDNQKPQITFNIGGVITKSFGILNNSGDLAIGWSGLSGLNTHIFHADGKTYLGGKTGIGTTPGSFPLTVLADAQNYGLQITSSTYGKQSFLNAGSMSISDGSVSGVYSTISNTGATTWYDALDGHLFRGGSTYGYPQMLQLNANNAITAAFQGVGTAKTVTGKVISAVNSGNTYNTTTGALNAYSGYFASTATRSAGTNALTNVGLYASASGGQNNYAAIFDQGAVTIGTLTAPSGYKLAVGGNIIAEKVKVQLQTAWPDYVFQRNYKLPSLNEIEKFIKTNNHLPGVPSATEVEKEGLDLGETQAIMLKKIEELTLYLIEMNKKIEKLTAENEQLREKLLKSE